MPPCQRDHYDSPWKSAGRRYFRQFVRFFYPALYELIDWRRGWRFREQELEQVSLSDKPSLLIADLVVEIFLRDREQNALIHIEIHGKQERSLKRRMFSYFARLCALTELPVISLLLTPRGLHSPSVSSVPEFAFNLLRASIGRLPLGMEDLIAHRNPFGPISAAYLLAQKTANDMPERYREKFRILTENYAKGWSNRMKLDVFRVVNWMMALPPELERKLWREIHTFERRSKMNWMCPIEKIFFEDGEKRGIQKGLKQGRASGMQRGIEKGVKKGVKEGIKKGIAQGFERGFEQGIEQGIERGIEQGIEQGIEEGTEYGRRAALTNVLIRQLEIRFGPISNAVRKRVMRAGPEQLESWAEAVVGAQTLKEVFGM